jgi:hypothetical protein
VSIDLETQVALECDVLLPALATTCADLLQSVLVKGLANDFKIEIAITAQTGVRGIGRRITPLTEPGQHGSWTIDLLGRAR